MGVVDFVKSDVMDPAVDYLTDAITKRLKSGQKVTWLVTGGSAIAVAAAVSKKLARYDLSNLSVTLTDERFVPNGDADSNGQQLLDGGFSLPGARLFPILENEDVEKTTQHYAEILHKVLDGSGYKIGLFGMGLDGHVAALFPNFPQLNEQSLYAVSLDNSPKPPPLRMTMTIPAIQKLDEAVLFTRGSERKTLTENLTKNLKPSEQPAQILKTLPRLTIFNDQIGEIA